MALKAAIRQEQMKEASASRPATDDEGDDSSIQIISAQQSPVNVCNILDQPNPSNDTGYSLQSHEYSQESCTLKSSGVNNRYVCYFYVP